MAATGMEINADTVENRTEAPKKLKVQLSDDLVILLVRTYPAKMKTLTQKGVCPPVL